jgi:hypothetical protein
VSGVTYATNAVPIDYRVSFFDADYGMVWRSETSWLGQGTRSSLGVTWSHIPRQDESLLGIVTKRPWRWTVHGGMEIPVAWIDGAGRRQIAWSPNFKLDFQEGLTTMGVGVYAIYQTLYIGAMYQDRVLAFSPVNTNGITFCLGYKAKINKGQTLLIGYSFDASTSGLSVRTGGSHEVALRYNFSDVQLFRQGVHDKKGKRIMNCKAFF